MASAANTVQTLNGHFKEIYADNIKDLRPQGVKMINMIDFIEASKRLGNQFNLPVVLGYEHGFSYGGNSGQAFSLNNAISAAHENAQIKGHELVLRSFLSVGAASRSMNEGKGAFIQETKYIVENMLKSYMHRLEAQMMYGQSGIGKVEGVSGAVIDIEPEEWAPGIWAGSENMEIEIFSAVSGGTLRGTATVQSVDFDTRKITVTGVPAGTTAGDFIFHKGARDKEFAGLHKISENTTSTLFGIDASTYSLYRGNIIDVGTNFAGNEAVLSFDKVEEGLARMMEKGLSEEDTIVLCNPRSWKNLLTEQAAKRQYDSSFSSDKMENGSKSIRFYAQSGTVEIKSSIYVKEGFAYIFSPKQFTRIGSSDVTFEQPGFEGKFLKLLESTNAYEMRLYSDQALFAEAPGQTALLRYIKS